MRPAKTIIFTVFALWLTQFAVAQSHDSFAPANADPVKLVKIYPNPATDYLSIKFDTPIAKTIEVTLHNIIGNTIEIEREIVDEYEVRLKVKELPTGYYLIALRDEGNARNSIKFLKH